MPSVYPLRRNPSQASQHTYTHKVKRPVVEVLDEIIAITVAKHKDFSRIANISLASYVLRQIALRHFFAMFAPVSSRHWSRCCQIPGIFSWVRKLKCTTDVLTLQPTLLLKLLNLQVVELDFLPDGLATQAQRVKLLLSLLPATLTELRLLNVPRIDTHILGLVAAQCPALETLDVTCIGRFDEGCCWLCFEESSTCIIHSPIPDVYPSIKELSVAFGTALKPLQRLQHVFLGILLSSSDIFDAHFQHRFGPYIMYSDGPIGPDGCGLCVQNHALLVRQDELIAGAMIASILPSLQTISWSTWFAREEEGDESDDRLTTVWIRRADGVIHARREPW
ncbi:uncharacterized protein C8Q71DRAFT_795251 [Rhodofomes roseus]|uniref:F-box domain-containing protein n=1 Tax=Rhodofomes roseus TaxID=34475 RepID=A0ABQ8KNU5_9APHY|nr:uncharacterized protein C8Q71DRAFT_795251 [Rhodofomes roseus]KAH9840059.1 hypothetical protein C8Q71DRAFT_795251 [Rhodofomes roseus]